MTFSECFLFEVLFDSFKISTFFTEICDFLFSKRAYYYHFERVESEFQYFFIVFVFVFEQKSKNQNKLVPLLLTSFPESSRKISPFFLSSRNFSKISAVVPEKISSFQNFFERFRNFSSRLQGLGLQGTGHGQLVAPLSPEGLPHPLVDVRPVGLALEAEDDILEGSILVSML
jgi:hypothetical protein